jgi:hypothetical protein
VNKSADGQHKKGSLMRLSKLRMIEAFTTILINGRMKKEKSIKQTNGWKKMALSIHSTFGSIKKDKPIELFISQQKMERLL